jgi:3-methyladenine DNA glycosylase AlkD
MIKQAIRDWVNDPEHWDQETKGKNAFLQSGKYEKTRLKAVGIANPTLKKAAAMLYKGFKEKPFEEVLQEVDDIMIHSKIYEEQLLAIYLLEKYRREFEQTTFKTIDKWIDDIDYWAISDHLAINLFGNFPLEEQWYRDRLREWLESDHYWRRRQGLTAYLHCARNHAELLEPVLETIIILLPEDNYYIQKAIPWVLRESYRKHPQNHQRVNEFISKHMTYFNKTMLREAMRYLSESMQESLLNQYENQ